MSHNISLILPDIRSCHNVGAMFRSADAFGIERLYLVGYTAHPPKVQIDKVSLGAETWVPWERRDDLKELIRELRTAGLSIYALEKTLDSHDIDTVSIDRDVALIVGNEVDGIAPDILALCDRVIHIPMVGKKESLNVSIAAGIAMYKLTRD